MTTPPGPADSPDSPPPRLPRAALWPRLLMVACLAAALVACYAFGLFRSLSREAVRDHLDNWLALVAANLLLALAVYFAVYLAAATLSLPVVAVLTLLGGALFGRWLGTAVVSVASTLGATLSFLASRYLLRDWVQRRFGARLEAINRGMERDGAFYLFALRLVPVIPFSLINLGMGLTRIRPGTFVLVSWLGMLPLTFLYVSTGTALGTLDGPEDLLTAPVLVPLALIGILPLAFRKLIQARVKARTLAWTLAVLLVAAGAALGARTFFRYRATDVTLLPVQELGNADYPEDPADRSVHYGQYNGRRLRLIKFIPPYFTFVFEPTQPHVARITIKDVDAGLMTPGLPEWAKADPGLTRIALTDRQWNRQQVQFDRGDRVRTPTRNAEVFGGDGFEYRETVSVELAKNCLNAGLWELLLYTREGGQKKLYYHGWFTFPLGQYNSLFERNTGLRYANHWWYLEHWFDPAGTPVPLAPLREVVEEVPVQATRDPDGEILVAGEQAGKRRTVLAENLRHWGDFYDGRHKVRFASFVPPGRYSVKTPWKNGYARMDRFERAELRRVRSPAREQPLDELELVFSSSHQPGVVRFLVGGFDRTALPRLPVADYAKGTSMPMGIGTPPFFQSYAELEANRPEKSPFFSVLLDGEGRWLDHHAFAIDGSVLHRDEKDPDVLHAYLLSYERHTLIGHVVLRVGR